MNDKEREKIAIERVKVSEKDRLRWKSYEAATRRDGESFVDAKRRMMREEMAARKEAAKLKILDEKDKAVVVDEESGAVVSEDRADEDVKKPSPKYIYMDKCPECGSMFGERPGDFCHNCGKRRETKKVMEFVGLEVPSKEMKELASKLAEFFDVVVKVYADGTEIVAKTSACSSMSGTSSEFFGNSDVPEVCFRIVETDWDMHSERYVESKWHYRSSDKYQEKPKDVGLATGVMLEKFKKWYDCILSYYHTKGLSKKLWIMKIRKSDGDKYVATNMAFLF